MEKEIRFSNLGFVSSQESLKREIAWIRQILSSLEMTNSYKDFENQEMDLLRSLMKTQEAVNDFQFKLTTIFLDLLQEVEYTRQESQLSSAFLESDFQTSLF